MQYRLHTYSAMLWDVYWFEKNIQGDVVAIYNSQGTKLISYTYTAYGMFNVTYHNSGYASTATKNRIMYRGYYLDADLQMYYLNSRYYNQNTCRFISPDSVMSGVNGSLHGFNLYAYCFNNPVNMTDASGNWPEWIEAVASVTNKMADSFVKSIEADVGAGVGLGGDVEIFQGTAYRDSYVGYDDGMAVTGNRAVFGITYFVGAQVVFDHRVEENGKLVTDSVNPNDGLLDMINYSDTDYSISLSGFGLYGEFGSKGVDFGFGVDVSCHLGVGAHASVSFSVFEYFVRIFS